MSLSAALTRPASLVQSYPSGIQSLQTDSLPSLQQPQSQQQRHSNSRTLKHTIPANFHYEPTTPQSLSLSNHCVDSEAEQSVSRKSSPTSPPTDPIQRSAVSLSTTRTTESKVSSDSASSSTSSQSSKQSVSTPSTIGQHNLHQPQLYADRTQKPPPIPPTQPVSQYRTHHPKAVEASPSAQSAVDAVDSNSPSVKSSVSNSSLRLHHPPQLQHQYNMQAAGLTRSINHLQVHDTLNSDLSDLNSPSSVAGFQLNRTVSMPQTFDEQLTAAAVSYSIRCLVVEGHRVHRQHVASKLKMMSCAVDEVDSAPSALSLLKEFHYDICFLASELDRVSGLDLCLLVHSQLGPQCPIIVLMTQADFPDERDRAITCGVDTQIHRPARTRELQRIVEIWHGNANKVLHRPTNFNTIHSTISDMYGTGMLGPSAAAGLPTISTPEPFNSLHSLPSARSSSSLSQLSMTPAQRQQSHYRNSSCSASNTPAFNGNRKYHNAGLSRFSMSLSATNSPSNHSRTMSLQHFQYAHLLAQQQYNTSTGIHRSPGGPPTQMTYVASAPLDYKMSIQAGLKAPPEPDSPDKVNQRQFHIRHPRSRPSSPGRVNQHGLINNSSSSSLNQREYSVSISGSSNIPHTLTHTRSLQSLQHQHSAMSR